MRKILFRGKRLDNREWVEGYYFVKEPPLTCFSEDAPEQATHHILRTGFADWNLPRPIVGAEVDPSTIGQYTGLNDKNGVRIFEGDIVAKRTCNGKKMLKVSFSDGMFHCGFGGGSSTRFHPYTLKDGQIEVVGNICDNPELLS